MRSRSHRCRSQGRGFTLWVLFGCVTLALMAASRPADADTFTVTSVEDSGPGTLRQAIMDADAHAGADVIAFNIASGGAQTIAPQTPLPAVTDPVTIDGTTQPGYVGVPIIEIDGSQAADSILDGLDLQAPGCAVMGLVINRCGNAGIFIEPTAAKAVISNCYLGVDVGGSTPLGNAYGVQVESASSITVSNCLISGNGFGVWLDGACKKCLIQNCLIGLDVSGSVDVGNLTGVEIDGGSANTVDSNTISANADAGVSIGYDAVNNRLTNNSIGVDLFFQPQPNGGQGIDLWQGNHNTIKGNLIAANLISGISLHSVDTHDNSLFSNDIEGNAYGIDIYDQSSNNTIGASGGKDNEIAGNLADGVAIEGPACSNNQIQYNEIENNGRYGVLILNSGNSVQFNTIDNNALDGVDVGSADGVTYASAVPILSNAIFDNGDLGIRLERAPSGKVGGNNLQPAPTLSLAVSNSGALTVIGTLSAAPNTAYQVQFFDNDTPDPSGYGEGQLLLGTISVTTDSNGNVVLNAALPAVVVNSYVSATATDPGGNTSQFSNTLIVGAANPVATITNLNPAGTIAGGPDQTITVTGSNFVSGSTVQFNGVGLATQFVTSTQLTATIPAPYIATAGAAQISVLNPAPGGGLSNTLNFAINNPVPALTAINPTTVTADGPNFTLTVTGTNFVNGATVNWNGAARATTFVSSTQLTATITSADIAASGTAQITVTNPVPGGGTSGALSLAIINPVPAISALNPTTAVMGGSAFTLTVNGSNFVSGSVVNWNGSARATTFLSATQIQAAVTAADIAATGTAQITVTNPTPGGGTSNAVSFTIVNPVPSLSSLNPNAVYAGNGAFTLTVNGSNFVNGAAVTWNGSARTTTFVSATQVTAQISAADVSAAGAAQVTVANPGPGEGNSNALTFTINAVNPTPFLTGLSPGSVAVGSPGITVSVSGAGFIAGSQAQWNGSPRTTTVISGNQLTLALTSADLASAGSNSITVVNPAPGGGTSNALTFLVKGIPQLAITSATATRGSNIKVAFTLQNIGTATASQCSLTIAKLGGTSTSVALPKSIGSIAPGASVTTSLTFPAKVASGKQVLALAIKASGQSLNASRSVTVPWSAGIGQYGRPSPRIEIRG